LVRAELTNAHHDWTTGLTATGLA